MSLVAYPLLALWTVAGVLAMPLWFGWLRWGRGWPPHRIVREAVWWYGRGWMATVRPFVTFATRGLGPGEIRGPAILVVNHLSFFDTYCMALLPVRDVVFAVRSWPFKMPWYAPFMRLAEYLDVEATPWEETAAACRKAFAEGSCVLFFPEGHRSRDGGLQRFFSGAFKLAVETGVPVVPLCIAGTEILLPPERFLLHPARVRLHALPPVDPRGFSGPSAHRELLRVVKARMAGELLAMTPGEPTP